MRETFGTILPGPMLFEIPHADYDNRDFPGVEEPTSVDLEGVPLGSYDFSGEVGEIDVGSAAMILQRLGAAEFYRDTGIAPTIRVEAEALQVRTTEETDLGSGVGHYYLTLDKSKQLLSTMVIIRRNEYGGVAHLSLNISFDVRFDSLDGKVVFSGEGCFMGVDIPWSFEPQPNAVEIRGATSLLNGKDTSNDMWPAVNPHRISLPTHIVIIDGGWHGAVCMCGARQRI